MVQKRKKKSKPQQKKADAEVGKDEDSEESEDEDEDEDEEVGEDNVGGSEANRLKYFPHLHTLPRGKYGMIKLDIHDPASFKVIDVGEVSGRVSCVACRPCGFAVASCACIPQVKVSSSLLCNTHLSVQESSLPLKRDPDRLVTKRHTACRVLRRNRTTLILILHERNACPPWYSPNFLKAREPVEDDRE